MTDERVERVLADLTRRQNEAMENATSPSEDESGAAFWDGVADGVAAAYELVRKEFCSPSDAEVRP